MAYLDRNGVVRTADQKKYDMPESGIFNELFTYLESFVAKTKRASSMDNNQLNALGREIRESVDKSMLLMYINNHLFRMNNYYDYEFIPYKEPDTLYVYKMVQTGEMRDIWSPIKVINYRKTYNIEGYEAESTEIVTAEGDDYTRKGEVTYKRYVESTININKLMYGLGADFFKLVREINQIAPFGITQTRENCITTNKNYTVHYMNPYYYIIDTSGHYFTTRNKILEIAREINRTGQLTRDRIEADNRINYLTAGGTVKPVDHASYGLFFKSLNNDLEWIQEYFMRYAVYSSSIDFEGNTTLTSRTNRADAIKFCTDLGWIIERILPIVKRVTRLPTGPTESILTNNIFKKANYLELMKRDPVSHDRDKYFFRPTGVERGEIITAESLMRYLVINLGLKLNELARYNPLVKVLGGSGIRVSNIPIFGSKLAGTVMMDFLPSNDIYNVLSPITGSDKTVEGRLKLEIKSENADDNDPSRGRLGFYHNLNGEEAILLGNSKYVERIIERGKELFKEGYSDKYNDLSGLRSYLSDDDFSNRFERKYGVPPTRYHLIPISIVELIIRYLLGSVKSSCLLRMRYEPLPKKYLDVFNDASSTNFPLGTKFLYISFYTDGENNSTTNIGNHGRRLSEDDLVNTYVNKGYSNKWGVTDQETLSAINKLERLGDHVVLNKESLDIMLDVVYKVVINYISTPSREDIFRTEVDKTMALSQDYQDPDIKRHILLPLLDDMRKNSDFS